MYSERVKQVSNITVYSTGLAQRVQSTIEGNGLRIKWDDGPAFLVNGDKGVQ